MIEQIRLGLERHHDANLVRELLEAHREARRNFYAGGLRLAEVEGGRFCEAAFRILEEASEKHFTPLSRKLEVEKLVPRLASLPVGDQPDSIRLHIPRVLRVVYDIRNNRDAAHLADGIDPNVQDAMLVVAGLDWVLAEFVRLYHTVPADEAQRIVASLVKRRAPAVEEIEGNLKVLKPDLAAGDHVLLLLYERGDQGATTSELKRWIRSSMRANLNRTLERLREDLAFTHTIGGRHIISAAGIQEVEERNLHHVT